MLLSTKQKNKENDVHVAPKSRRKILYEMKEICNFTLSSY